MPGPDYASFMVRLWRAPVEKGTDREGTVWMGEVESVQTGRTWRFQDVDALSAWLVMQLADPSKAIDQLV